MVFHFYYQCTLLIESYTNAFGLASTVSGKPVLTLVFDAGTTEQPKAAERTA